MSDSVGSVSVDVVPDARGWAEKLRAQIRDQTVKVTADADTGEANAKLDEVARDRHSTINVDVNKSQIQEGASALDSMVGKLGVLPALAIAAGAALVPLAATVGSMAIALAAPIAIAGGGVGLFAVLGSLAAKDTEAKLKAIDKLRQHLGTLTKGTSAYAQAQQQLHDAEKALTPEQKKFAAAQDSLTGAFQKFLQGSAGKTLLDVMAQGMGLLAHLLPIVAPIITTVGGAISSLLSDVGRAAQSRGFGHIVDQFARLSGRDIRIGAQILGDLAKGVGSLLLATDKGFSGGFLRGIERLTSSFANWASSKQARHELRDFFDYAHRVGPQVAHTIGALARALGKVVEALAPLGPVVLKGIEVAANSLAAIPIPVLTALAAAFVGIVGFQKLGGFKGLGALSGALSGSKGGGIGSTLARTVGGGIQKVYVVNMGPGGLGAAGGAAEAESKYLPFLAVLPELAVLLGAGIGVYLITKHIAIPDIKSALQSQAQQGILPTLGSDAHRRASQISQTGMLAMRQQHLGDNGAFVFNPVTKGYDWVSYAERAATKVDALRASLARASRQIDMVGPHADAAFGAASKDVETFAGKLAAVHDKKLAVILQDQAAIRSLEALQRMRIADKSFNIYARYQAIERAVGPRGGMGRPGLTSSGSDGTIHTHVHLDGKEIGTAVTPYAQRVYDQNRTFEAAHQ